MSILKLKNRVNFDFIISSRKPISGGQKDLDRFEFYQINRGRFHAILSDKKFQAPVLRLPDLTALK